MIQKSQIQLDYSSILQFPFDNLYNDFTFIVNDEEFQTNKFVSILLSPKINQQQLVDPTIDTFIINTKEKGNFAKVLQLINFKQNDVSEEEIPFLREVLEILNNDKIRITEKDKKEMTKDNIIQILHIHEKYPQYYSNDYEEEINFISKNFSEVIKTHQEKIHQLKIETIERIINNDHLSIDNEDELLEFITKIYKKNRQYSFLYENVCFNNLTINGIKKFVSIFDMNDITSGIWIKLCERLENEQQEITKQQGIKFTPNEKEPFSGIINYFRTESNKIDEEIQISVSSNFNENGNELFQPKTILLKENPKYYFVTKDIENSWISIDFKKNRINPTHYTIRSGNRSPNGNHLKSWVIEVSNDQNNWEIIDEVNDCHYLNGSRFVHTFKIQKEQTNVFRYFRIRQPEVNWCDQNHLRIETIEIYGILFKK